ncbi:MAG: hypothetical protein JSR49_10980 [Proteobacteria bacterium]|nr:hypothetical protein [Pseudomonadota bacterium]
MFSAAVRTARFDLVLLFSLNAQVTSLQRLPSTTATPYAHDFSHMTVIAHLTESRNPRAVGARVAKLGDEARE